MKKNSNDKSIEKVEENINNITKHNKRRTVKIIGMIVFALAIIVLLVYYFILSSFNNVVGKWNCGLPDKDNQVTNYSITLELKRNRSFVHSLYGTEKDNYTKGKYSVKNIENSNRNNNNSDRFFEITLNGKKQVVDGVSHSVDTEARYEMGIMKNKKEAVLSSVMTWAVYHCELSK